MNVKKHIQKIKQRMSSELEYLKVLGGHRKGQKSVNTAIAVAIGLVAIATTAPTALDALQTGGENLTGSTKALFALMPLAAVAAYFVAVQSAAKGRK